MNTTNSSVNIRGITVRIIHPDIIRYEVPKDMQVTLEVMKDLASYGESVFPSQKRKVLTVFNTNFIPSKEASDFMISSERVQKVAAEAFCINSAALRILTNFYFKIKKPVIKSRTFDDEALAIAWLRSQ